MKIAELRHSPFILLVLKDGLKDGDFSAEFIDKTKQQLSDMSLRIASDYLSIIYADQIKRACEVVLGIINLGLLSHCDNDTEKAKEIIKTQGIVYCFRAGWAKYAELKKIAPDYFKEINITEYALGTNDTSDITIKHAGLVKNGYDSIKLLEVYKHISSRYSANAIIPEHDEDIVLFELQRLLNSALGLLLIDSERKVFNTSLFNDLVSYLTVTDKEHVLSKLTSSIDVLIESLPLTTKMYLKEMALVEFAEFKRVMSAKNNLTIYLQEILELPVTVSNELNNDFEGEDTFGTEDDQDDIAYLKPE
jgi:hypothetical protein